MYICVCMCYTKAPLEIQCATRLHRLFINTSWLHHHMLVPWTKHRYISPTVLFACVYVWKWVFLASSSVLTSLIPSSFLTTVKNAIKKKKIKNNNNNNNKGTKVLLTSISVQFSWVASTGIVAVILVLQCIYVYTYAVSCFWHTYCCCSLIMLSQLLFMALLSFALVVVADKYDVYIRFAAHWTHSSPIGSMSRSPIFS